MLGSCVRHYARSDGPKFINNFRTVFLGLYIFCLLSLLPICALRHKSYATWLLKAAHWFLIARRMTVIKASVISAFLPFLPCLLVLPLLQPQPFQAAFSPFLPVIYISECLAFSPVLMLLTKTIS